MRDPALHITKSNLVKVLQSVGIKVDESKATEILKRAQPYQIKDRYQLQGNSRQRKKADKLVAAEKENPYTEVFQRLLTAYRQQIGHKFIRAVRESDREYVMLKEVSQSAETFATTFGLQREDGYKKFIQLGLTLMGKKYGLNRFKTYNEKIFFIYENLIVVSKDIDKEGTKQFYSLWKEAMTYYAAIDPVLTDIEMVNMVYGRQEADECGAKYYDWIIAQFEGLAWLDAIPELSQFYGENAKKRYDKYVATLQKTVEEEKDNLPVKFESEAEAEYYKNLRNKNAGK